MSNKQKKNKLVSQKSKPAAHGPAKSPSRKGSPAAASKTGSKPAPKAGASSAADAKDAAGKKSPGYLQLIISLARDLGGKIPLDALNDYLPSDVNAPEEIERVVEKLRKLEIEVVRDPIDLEAAPPAEAAQAEKTRETARADTSVIDDPVRMYLKQMGQVPLLTREQEVEISKRIEEAEINAKRLIHRFGFAPQAYFDMIERLKTSRERFDRVITDKHEGEKAEKHETDKREIGRDKYFGEIIPRLNKSVPRAQTAVRERLRAMSVPRPWMRWTCGPCRSMAALRSDTSATRARSRPASTAPREPRPRFSTPPVRSA